MTTRPITGGSLHLFLLPARRRSWQRAPATTVELLLGPVVPLQVRPLDVTAVPAGAS